MRRREDLAALVALALQRFGKLDVFISNAGGFVRTRFAESMTDRALKAAVEERMERIAIAPEAIAGAILYAIGQPADIDVGDIVIRPTAQD